LQTRPVCQIKIKTTKREKKEKRKRNKYLVVEQNRGVAFPSFSIGLKAFN